MTSSIARRKVLIEDAKISSRPAPSFWCCARCSHPRLRALEWSRRRQPFTAIRRSCHVGQCQSVLLLGRFRSRIRKQTCLSLQSGRHASSLGKTNASGCATFYGVAGNSDHYFQVYYVTKNARGVVTAAFSGYSALGQAGITGTWDWGLEPRCTSTVNNRVKVRSTSGSRKIPTARCLNCGGRVLNGTRLEPAVWLQLLVKRALRCLLTERQWLLRSVHSPGQRRSPAESRRDR